MALISRVAEVLMEPVGLESVIVIVVSAAVVAVAFAAAVVVCVVTAFAATCASFSAHNYELHGRS